MAPNPGSDDSNESSDDQLEDTVDSESDDPISALLDPGLIEIQLFFLVPRRVRRQSTFGTVDGPILHLEFEALYLRL